MRRRDHMFPIDRVRSEFPALHQGDGFIFFDNAAGAQVPKRALDAVIDHLTSRNVQRGGPYSRSREVDAAIERARAAVADFINAFHPDEVAFGMNATSFVRSISLAIGQTLAARREIVVTDLDHESNIATWLALERAGAQIRWWHTRDDATLHLEDLEPLLSPRTRVVACTAASNAIGTKVDITAVCERSHKAGAEVFLDAVHYAPHGRIDVQAIGCDYLVCSGYKIFAPHMGFLWGRRDALNGLPTFREDFIPDTTPAKLEVGTYVYENVAGMDAAIAYLEGLAEVTDGRRRDRLAQAMDRIREYELELTRVLLERMSAIPGVTVHGIADPDDAGERVPTVCFTVAGMAPADVSRQLSDRGIGVRDGHMYAPRLIRRLGLSDRTGAVRASLVHYNTTEEIDRFAEDLRTIAGSR